MVNLDHVMIADLEAYDNDKHIYNKRTLNVDTLSIHTTKLLSVTSKDCPSSTGECESSRSSHSLNVS